LAAGALQLQYYPRGGQEAIPAAVAPHLTIKDKSVITYRCIHDIVAKGTPIREIIAEMYGRETGTSKGKGGPMHLSDPNNGLMVTTGIVGVGAPIPSGITLCVDDPDPCIFLEAMRCYFVPGEVPELSYRIPIGQAKVAKPDRDLTIISYSWAMHETLAAAALLAEQGVGAEVIDLRSIVPLDLPTVLASVAKTGRAMIAHGAVEFGGFGAELAARIQGAA
jgi:transketolase C-terminal domain/subunit